LIAVLAYHNVGEVPDGGWETWFRVPESLFSDQLAYLETNGWEVLTLPAFLAALDDPGTASRHAALITFDDGYRSLREVALPHLERFGFPAVVFVPTDFIGGVNSFDADVEPEEPICDWNDLRALEDAGVSVQSHGASHRALSTLASARLDDELRRSKHALEEGLTKRIEVFAYPYGDRGAGNAVQTAGYRAAFLYKGGPISVPVDDPFALPRIPIGSDTDLTKELTPGPSAARC
jgi:peptidoglycan/xylan/chitin deacetylase (PgdA/CDA1 family)